MIILWSLQEQQATRPISDNNASRKFNNLAYDTQIKDLKPLLGFDMFQDLIQNPTTTANTLLLSGGTYTYNGITYQFEGLKKVLCYLFYANYVMDNLQDTFHGFVTQNTEDSTAASSGDKKNLRDQNHEIAMQHWVDCKHFIECNYANYPYFNCRTQNNRLITL